MRNVRRYAVLAAVAFLAACGDDDTSGTGPDESALGSFSGNVGGDITGALAGVAGHAAVSTGPVDEQGFLMAFEDAPSGSTVTASIVIGRDNPALPSVGQHVFKDAGAEDVEIGANDYVMLAVVTDAQGTDWLCSATGGSMTVSASSAARIQGTLALTASCIAGASEATKDVTLSGSFDSRAEQVSQVRAMFAWGR